MVGFAPIIDPEATSGGSDEAPFLEAGLTAGGYAIYPVHETDLAYHLLENDVQNVQSASLRTIGICSAHFLAMWIGGGPAK